MNLFDAVPTVVRNNFDLYDVDESISSKEIAQSVHEVIELCDNFDNETIKRQTWLQIRLMVSNAVDLLLHDRDQFNELMFQ